MAELALQGVSKIYSNHVAAVQDLNLTIRDQELVVLVGPSGCGKTTTLRLIAGLDDLSNGVIRFDGRLVNPVLPRNRNVAMVFQHSVLYPHLSAYNNIAFGLRMRHGGNWIRKWWTRIRHPMREPTSLSRQAIAEEVLRAARILGIDHLLDRMPRELSGGERQRVALGRAIVRRPAAFLLDEPLSSIDPQLRTEMRRDLKRLHRRLGATMVYVTHDQAEALALGDRIAVMHQGRLQQVGTPREVYERPANLCVARFVGEPTMNIVQGHLRSDSHGLCFLGSGLSVPLPTAARERWDGNSLANVGSRAVVLGIRPEHVSVAAVDTGPQDGIRAEASRGCRWDSPVATSWCGQGRVVEMEWFGATLVAMVAMTRRADGGDVDASSGVDTCSRMNEASGERRSTHGPASPPVWAVSLSGSRTVEVGAQVAVYMDTTQTHMFDACTSQSLLRVRKSSGESTDLPGLDREP